MMGHKAILHIYSTFNNVLITATDLTGAETVCKVSGGMVTKGGSDSGGQFAACLLYTSPSPRDNRTSRMPSSA